MPDSQVLPPLSPTRRMAIDFYNRSLSEIGGDKNLSYRLCASAVEIEPDFAAGWKQLGAIHGELKMFPAAIAAFRRVLSCTDAALPGGLSADMRAKTMVDLGHRLYHEGTLAEAESLTRAALDLDPALAYGWCNLSLILSLTSRHDEAIETARRAFALAPEPTIETGLAFALLFAGKFAEGLRHFEARLPYKLPQYLSYPYPLWRGESGKHLVVIAEQGFGDTLSFARFIPAASRRCSALTVLCQPELLRLFRAALPSACACPVEIVGLPAPFMPADYWISPTSLPVALGLDDDGILSTPFPPVPVVRTPSPWKAPGTRLHVGIAWGGAPENEIDRWRSLTSPLPFLDLYRVPGIQLYSLQVGPRAAELGNSGCIPLIKDLSPFIRDVSDTISILHDLDLVITVETSLGHITGAIGKETWTLYAYCGGDFRHGRDRASPIWYPQTTIFRQTPSESPSWSGVFDRIVAALQKKLSKKD